MKVFGSILCVLLLSAAGLAENDSKRSARMDVLHVDGVFSDVENILLTEFSSSDVGPRDYKKSIYTLTLGDKNYDFMVTQVDKTNCGSYEVQLTETNDRQTQNQGYMHMVLVDHTFRVCKDAKAYTWEALVTYFPYNNEEPPSRLDISGSPR